MILHMCIHLYFLTGSTSFTVLLCIDVVTARYDCSAKPYSEYTDILTRLCADINIDQISIRAFDTISVLLDMEI